MDSVNKTLYIPLYGKALVSRRGLFIKDESAEKIWDEVGFPLKGKAKSKWLAFYMGIRAAVFDKWAIINVFVEIIFNGITVIRGTSVLYGQFVDVRYLFNHFRIRTGSRVHIKIPRNKGGIGSKLIHIFLN